MIDWLIDLQTDRQMDGSDDDDDQMIDGMTGWSLEPSWRACIRRRQRCSAKWW